MTWSEVVGMMVCEEKNVGANGQTCAIKQSLNVRQSPNRKVVYMNEEERRLGSPASALKYWPNTDPMLGQCWAGAPNHTLDPDCHDISTASTVTLDVGHEGLLRLLLISILVFI